MNAVVSTNPTPPRDEVARLRVPPHSIEAEQSILGGLLLDSAAFARICDLFDPADFYRHEHRAIFEAIVGLIGGKRPVDVITVFEQLQTADKHETAGGLAYLNNLTQSVPSAANIVRYAEIVRERAMLRRLIALSDEIATKAFNPQGAPLADLLDSAKVAISQLAQSQGPSRRGVPLLSLGELREQAHTVLWLIKHVVPADSIGMLYGGSGTFKSFIAIDAALHVAHGLPWLGRRTQQGSVLYIAAEGGTGLWGRICAWHKARRLQYTDVPLTVVPVAVDLTNDAWRVVEAAQAKGITPSLVVVDTLSQTFAGEENSADQVAAYFRELGNRFRALWHCSVMLLHHTGHVATERPRGSSVMRANLDWMIGVHRDEKEMLATISCAKVKDGESWNDTSFALTKIDLGNDEDGDIVHSLVARHLSSADAIREVMEAEGKAGRGGSNHLLLSLLQNGMAETELRQLFYKDCGGDTPEARKKAYMRARTWATQSGLMEVSGGVVITLKSGDPDP